jgi:hypothetical protein
MGKYRVVFISRLLLASFALLTFPITRPAWGRDPDERYKDSPLHDCLSIWRAARTFARSLTGTLSRARTEGGRKF